MMIQGQLYHYFILLAVCISIVHGSLSSSKGSDLSSKSVGFLGCGKISSAVARGYAGKSGYKDAYILSCEYILV